MSAAARRLLLTLPPTIAPFISPAFFACFSSPAEGKKQDASFFCIWHSLLEPAPHFFPAALLVLAPIDCCILFCLFSLYKGVSDSYIDVIHVDLITYGIYGSCS
jgi:hypothetical protein